MAGNILGHRGTPTFIFYNMGLRSACAHGEIYILFELLPFISINKAKYTNLQVFQ